MLHKEEALLFSKERNAWNRNDQHVVCLELNCLFLYYKMLTVCPQALVRCHEACWILRQLHPILLPNLQSCKEYKPWKWGVTVRYYASHKKNTLPTMKSVPRSSRQSDNRKTTWPSSRDANYSGMDMSPVHQVWPKPPCKAQWKGEEDKADRRGGKTTSGNGQAWSSPKPRGQWRTGKNGGNWLWNHLWCPSDPRG